MQNAGYWLASVFGPLIAIVGLWRVIHADKLLKVINAVKASPGLLYYTSVAYLWIGLVILSQYAVWDWSFLALVTLLGWFLIVRGIVGLFAPHLLHKCYEEKSGHMKVCGFIPLIWGLILCWGAFFM